MYVGNAGNEGKCQGSKYLDTNSKRSRSNLCFGAAIKLFIDALPKSELTESLFLIGEDVSEGTGSSWYFISGS
jgi:hypothetical protein